MDKEFEKNKNNSTNKEKTKPNNKPQNDKEQETSSQQKVRIVLLVAAIVLILLYGAQILALFETKVPYNEFMDQVEAGMVETADINKTNGKVTYALKDDPKIYKTNYPDTEDFVEMLLVNNVEIEIKETSWLMYVLQYGLTPIMIFAMLFFAFNMNKIGDGGFNVETVDSIKTRFSDVAGMTEIKEDLSSGFAYTPSISVKNASFSAPTAIAIAQAASSALIL